MKLRSAAAAVALLLAVAGLQVAEAREPGAIEGVTGEQLLAEPLAGEENREAVTHLYTFAPGTVMPWHIHADAHEVAYVIEGDFTMEIEGRDRLELKPGQSFYLAPNEVHRGMNQGSATVKLFVVRIKPKDKPLATNVPGPGSSAPSP